MKGVKLKCGLLLALFIIFGLSFVVSSDTSALKHYLTAMPLYDYQQFLPDNTVLGVRNADFSFSFGPNLMDNFDTSKTKSPMYFRPINNNDEECRWNGISYSNSGDWYQNGGTLMATPSAFLVYSDVRDSFPNSKCLQLSPFGKNGLLSMNYNSIPLLYQPFRSLSPYSYDYASYYYRQTRKNDNGMVYNSLGLSMFDIVGRENTRLMAEGPTSINIPIGVISDLARNSSDFVSIQQGTTIDFNYEIYITDILSYDDTLWDTAEVYLQYAEAYLPDNEDYWYSIYADEVQCDTQSEYDGYGLRLTWSCSWVSPYSPPDNAVAFNFYITQPQYPSRLWSVVADTSSDFTFDISFFTDSLYVVTDYDDTLGSSIGSSDTGSNTDIAPGSVASQIPGSGLEPDYDLSLTNMFGFNFLNPFAPLFQMFGDNSQCASIPILAGMLHADNSTYCPWFDSSVRNVLTPVLSFASVMLIFGFAVRWLGASSGNFFEDSKDETLSNVNHSGWRRYKK